MHTDEGLQTAIARAIRFFAATREPQALLWLAVMHTRFGIDAFADARNRFDDVLADQPLRSAPSARLRVLRRMADRDNPFRPEDMEAVSHPSDLIVACALYCDREGLPGVYPKALFRAAEQGGYYLTHVLLALVWIRENDCDVPLPDGFVDNVYRTSAAIINDDPAIVSDLRLEAGAFLCMAGQAALIDATFIETVLATQQEDGGWGISGDGRTGSDWHSTILGLLLLLHVQRRRTASH